MTDTVADMITIIRNAYLARKDEVRMPVSKMREQIAQILVDEGYLTQAERETKAPQDDLVLSLRYINREPAITGIERVSKPGQRLYATSDKIPYVLNGYGTMVITTSQGIMTDKQARKANVGGELLFKVW